MSTTLYIPRGKARKASRVSLPDRQIGPCLAAAVKRQQARRSAARLSDDAARWATWRRGEHRFVRPRSLARVRASLYAVALPLLLSFCLVMAVILLVLGVRVPAADVRHIAALVMSGVMFATFAFGMADRR